MEGYKWYVPLSAFGEAAPAEDQNDTIFGDIWTGLKEGVTTDLAHTATGLVDLAGSAVGADFSLTSAVDKAGLAEYSQGHFNELTPETQKALQEVEKADGFWGTLGAYVSNPRAAVYDVTRALPMSLAGGGIGAAGVKGAVSVAGRAAGKAAAADIAKNAARIQATGANAAAQASRRLSKELVGKELKVGQHTDLLKKARKDAFAKKTGELRQGFIDAANAKYGVDWLKSSTAANIGAAAGEGMVGAGLSAASIAQYNAENPESRAPLEGVGYAALTGIGTGVIAGAAGRIGGSVESAIFNKSVRETMANKPWAAVGKSAFTEGAEEAFQAPTETIPQNWAEGKPWDEDLGKNAAQSLVAGAAMGGGAHGLMRTLRFAKPGEGKPNIGATPVDVDQAVSASGATLVPETQPTLDQITQNIEAQAAEIARKREEANTAKAAKEAAKEAAKANVVSNEAVSPVATQQGVAAPVAQKPMSKAEQRRLERAKAKAEKEEAKRQEQQEKEATEKEYKTLYYVPEGESVPYKKVRGQLSTPGYAPGAVALRKASEATHARGMTHHSNLSTIMGNAYRAGATESPDSMAEWFEKSAERIRFQGGSSPHASDQAATYEIAAAQLRNPDKPFEQIKDEYERNLAFMRYKKFNDDAGEVKAYDVYDIRAGNLKPGKASVTVEFENGSATFQGEVRGKKFLPVAKQVDAYAEYFEGKKASHDVFKSNLSKLFAGENASVAKQPEASKALVQKSDKPVGGEIVKAFVGSAVAKASTGREAGAAVTELDTTGLTVGEGVVLKMLALIKSVGENQNTEKTIADFDKTLTEEERSAYLEERQSLIDNPEEHKEFYNKLGGEGLKYIADLVLSKKKDELVDAMGSEKESNSDNAKASLAALSSGSTSESENGESALEQSGISVTEDIGAAKQSDENGFVRRFLSDLLYDTLAHKAVNRDVNGKRIVEVDTSHAMLPDGAIESLVEAVGKDGDFASVVEAALTGDAALKLVENKLDKGNKQKAATSALELLATLDRLTSAAGIDSKKLAPLTTKLFDIYQAGQESSSGDGYASGTLAPGVHPDRDLIRAAIKPINAVGKKIQNASVFITTPYFMGVAVKVKTLFELSNNLQEDLRGLFTPEFISRVIPVVEEYRAKGYPINDNLWLVDGSHKVLVNASGPVTLDSGGIVYKYNSKTQLYIRANVTGSVFWRDFDAGTVFMSCTYGNTNGNAHFDDHTATHELLHAMAYEKGKSGLESIWQEAYDNNVSSDIGRIMSMRSDADVAKFIPNYTLEENELDDLLRIVHYPQFAKDNAVHKARSEGLSKAEAETIGCDILLNESGATFYSLSKTNKLFQALLNSGQFELLRKTIERVEYDYLGASAHDVRGREEDSGRRLQEDRNRSGQSAYYANQGIRGRVLPKDGGVGKGSSERAVGAGASNGGRPQEGRTPGSGESGKKQGITVRLQRTVDKALEKLPARVRPYAIDLSHRLFTTALGGFFTRDVCNMAYDATGIKAFKKLAETHEKINTIRNEQLKTVSAVLNKKARLPANEQQVVNDYILDATLHEAWGYAHKSVFKTVSDYIQHVAKLDDAHRKAETEMRKRYNELTPAQKEVVNDYFDYGVQELRTQLQLMKEKEDLKRLPSVAEMEGNEDVEPPESSELKRRRNDIEHLTKFPYAPLMRAGKHMVIVKSAKYLKAEQELKLRSKVLSEMKEPTTEDRKWLKEARKDLEDLKSSGDDYIVEFVDGAGTAKELGEQYRKEIPGADVVTAERIEQIYNEIPGYQQIERWANLLAKNIEDGSIDQFESKHARALANELKNLLNLMYIRALSNNSAKKRRLKRRNTRGFNKDVFENLAAAAPSSANMMAYTRYSEDLSDNIREISTEVAKLRGDDRQTASEFQNELIKRENISNDRSGGLANNIMRGTSMWMLLGNPAFYIQNATQPFMMSAPFMASRHGLGVFRRLSRTTLEVARWMASDPDLSKLEKIMTDSKIPAKDKPMTMDEWKAMDHSRRHGHLDIGITQDFGDVIRNGKGVTDKVIGVTEKLTKAARFVEMMNRVSTFLTAYRSEIAKGSSAAKAREYADDVIYQTHGDYSAFNAPRWFVKNGFTKVITQFRKFQLIQAGLMLRLAANTFKGATPEVKAEARKQLAYIMLTHFAVTGMKGTPFVMMLLPAFAMGDAGDDDEDALRKIIGDKTLSDFLIRGLPAGFGVDVSGKVGAENMLSVLPYTEAKFSDGKEGANALIAGLLGPSTSIAQKIYTAGQYAMQGDYWKMFEYAAPNGVVANVMKAFRYGTEGYTSKAGDRLVNPDEYEFLDGVLQILGFQPRVMTDRMRLQDTLIRHKDTFDAEKNRIYMDFKKARHEKNGAAMAKARQEMAKLSKEARKQGLTGYSVANMISAANSQTKREAKAVGGVASNSSDRQFLKLMSNL